MPAEPLFTLGSLHAQHKRLTEEIADLNRKVAAYSEEETLANKLSELRYRREKLRETLKQCEHDYGPR